MKHLPSLLAFLLAAAWMGLSLVPAHETTAYRLGDFGRLPVRADGRVKPLDTVARNALLLCQGRQRVTLDTGREISPEEWLLDTLFRHAMADSYPIFRIDNPEVLSVLGVDPKAGSGGVRFSFLQLAAGFPELERQAQMADETDAADRTAFQRAAIDVADRVGMYVRLKFGWQGKMGRPAWVDLSPSPNYLQLQQAWQARDQDGFNAWVAARAAALAPGASDALRRSRWEFRFNAAQPFSTSQMLYVLAFLGAATSWLVWPRALGRAAWALLASAFVIATVGIAFRMWLEGRPPVTNLYSSALFIGWGAAGLCLLLEAMNRNGVATAAGGIIGFATLVIAHHLSLSGDTMEMMRAVLDSNFWLATHVVTVTVGYSATFLAGFLALIYVLRGALTRSLDADTARSLGRMVYGVICFATFFSFIGTVLGGIWADQSWGRFWGWDPKENGALMIVVWNALILHCRWAGVVRERGLMVMAIFGNVVTAWSWFGTNMLGVGLHSYGFTAAAFRGLVTFVVLQLAAMAVALLPLKKWNLS